MLSTRNLPKDTLIEARDVTLQYPRSPKPLLNDVCFTVRAGEKVTVVGENGVGKSTLLKLMMGKLEPTYGQITHAENLSVGYLPQNQIELSNSGKGTTLLEAVTSGASIEESATELLDAITHFGKDASETREAESYFNACGGYQLPQHMHGFGLTHLSYDHSFLNLSGGEKSKLALIRLFLSEHDLLILDEPTNHLDLEAIKWLETYLQRCPEAAVLVTHDRALLSRISRDIFELDVVTGKLDRFKGSYDKFLARKQAQFEHQLQQYHQQQERKEQLESEVKTSHFSAQQYRPTKKDNFKIGFNARGQRSQKNTSNKINRKNRELQRIQQHKVDRPEQSLKVQWQPPSIKAKAGAQLTISKLSIAFGDSIIARDCNLDVSVGERVLLTGPNGSGKSSILKAVMANDPATNAGGLRVGYMPQENDEMDLDLSVRDYFSEQLEMCATNQETPLDIIITEYCALSPKILHLHLAQLSMGQISRIKLAIALLQQPDILLLDEPTNHLDIYSAEHLERQLKLYNGGILAVSHDRRFIEQLEADKVYRFKDGALVLTENSSPIATPSHTR